MKRTFALVALLAALGVLCKLTLKEGPTAGAGGERSGSDPGPARTSTAPNLEAELLARYANGAPKDRALVERAVQKYRRNAVAIERTDGLRGLMLLDKLDLEAI